MEKVYGSCEESPLMAMKGAPIPPPLPSSTATRCYRIGPGFVSYNCVSRSACNTSDRLFDEGYRADVVINTERGGVIYAHASILGMASPEFKAMLKQSLGHGLQRSIPIRGVPYEAVRVFIRFLYSSCYEEQEIDEYALNLLVLSHVFVVPQLKRLCELKLEKGLLSVENVIDIFQLALLCDAPRLSLICHRFILKSFKAVSTTEGWKAMKESHPVLEKELRLSLIEEDNSHKERIKKVNERMIYLELYEAMEALVHVCKDGCQTIDPHDKVLKVDQAPCNLEACKGLERLVRHFTGCKSRANGRCTRCKRMWQLLDLHSRMCANSDICRVPLCKSSKEKITKQNTKEEMKWKILVRNILRTKSISSSPIFT